jgi:hypothetical protein
MTTKVLISSENDHFKISIRTIKYYVHLYKYIHTIIAAFWEWIVGLYLCKKYESAVRFNSEPVLRSKRPYFGRNFLLRY